MNPTPRADTDDAPPLAASGRKLNGAERLRARIVQLIADEGLAPGDRLPTEPLLSETFSASRSTVREAFKLLEQEGLVDAVQGRGRFLSATGSLAIERPITKYEGIADMLTELGYRVSTGVLSVTEQGATKEQAHALEIAEGDPVILLVRLRFGDDSPLVYSTDAIVRDALPGPITHRDWSQPITSALAANGHEIVSSAAHLSAVNLPAAVEDRYNLGGLGPWVVISETCITRTGKRVLVAEDYHRGDAIGFNVLRRR